MSLEVNKIAAAVLLAGIIGMAAGKITGALYPVEEPEKRGYAIAGAEEGGGAEGGGEAKNAGPVDILAFLGAADKAAGEQLFKTKCATCHTPEQGGPNKQGPNLWGVVGRGKGSHAGFTYSPGMLEKGGNWEFQDISEFLAKPSGYIKGTRMAFAGLKKPEDRANVIAYLNSLGSNKPVPAYAPPAAQSPPPAALP